MNWDASYLAMWGTMDFDTEEYHAVFNAMEELDWECVLASERSGFEYGEPIVLSNGQKPPCVLTMISMTQVGAYGDLRVRQRGLLRK